MPTGSSTWAPAPATTAAASSSRAPRRTWWPCALPSPASTSRPTWADGRRLRQLDETRRSLPDARDQPIPHPLRVVAVTRQLTLEKAFFQREPHHHEERGKDGAQSRG